MNVEGKVSAGFDIGDHNVTAMTARFIPIDFVSILQAETISLKTSLIWTQTLKAFKFSSYLVRDSILLIKMIKRIFNS